MAIKEELYNIWPYNLVHYWLLEIPIRVQNIDVKYIEIETEEASLSQNFVLLYFPYFSLNFPSSLCAIYSRE